MTVYVDDMFMKATVPNGARSVTGEWCHMQADTREELDAMADRIGLRRSWIQYPDDDVKRHYDVTRPRRAAAVAAGAVEVGMLDLAHMRAKWRAARRAARSNEPVHWVGDAPTSLHGNGAASFERTTRDRAEVTCSLCLRLLDREPTERSWSDMDAATAEADAARVLGSSEWEPHETRDR